MYEGRLLHRTRTVQLPLWMVLIDNHGPHLFRCVSIPAKCLRSLRRYKTTNGGETAPVLLAGTMQAQSHDMSFSRIPHVLA